jgi:hypothetical protein
MKNCLTLIKMSGYADSIPSFHSFHLHLQLRAGPDDVTYVPLTVLHEQLTVIKLATEYYAV